MAIFYPNGKSLIEITSLEDIISYYGHHLDGFDGIEVQNGHVLARIKGEYVCIGELR